MLKNHLSQHIGKSNQIKLSNISKDIGNELSEMLYVLNKHASSAELQSKLYRILQSENSMQIVNYKNQIKNLLYEYTNSAFLKDGVISIVCLEDTYCYSWASDYPRTNDIVRSMDYNFLWKLDNETIAIWHTGLQNPQAPFSEGSMLAVGKTMRNLYTNEEYAYVAVLCDMYQLFTRYCCDLYENETILILDEEENIIISNSEDNELFLSLNLNKKTTGDWNIYVINSENYIISTAAIEENGWTVVSVVPGYIALSGISKIQMNLIILLIGMLLLSVLFSYWLSIRITKPINELSRIICMVDKGNLDVKIAISSNDEIGQLANVFKRMLSSIKHLIQEQRDKEREKRLLEIRFLQSQINPHFINNTINTLKIFIQLRDWKTFNSILLNLSNILNEILTVSTEQIPLSNEISILEHYLCIRNICDMQDFHYSINISEEANHFLVPRLVLQPIVENCLAHGYDHIDDSFMISISANIVNDNLYVRVEDNGIGMTEEKLSELRQDAGKKKSSCNAHGIGLDNVRSRIKLYYRKHDFHIISVYGKGTTIEMVLGNPEKDLSGEK